MRLNAERAIKQIERRDARGAKRYRAELKHSHHQPRTAPYEPCCYAGFMTRGEQHTVSCPTPTAVRHEIRTENDTRELPPTQDGWRQFVHVGTATVTCSCGFNSGPIPRTDATRVASDHVGYDVTTAGR
jgi:hypothetical protein